MGSKNGLFVALLGPDGAGKTAVGDGMLLQLSPKFNGQVRYHLRPRLFKKKQIHQNNPVTNPHGKVPRGVFPSLAKLAYFWLDYTLGYWLRIRPFKSKSYLVLFDRYYHDLLIDPKRYRYGGPYSLALFTGNIIPKPDLFIILDAPAEIIHARKQEVTLEETTRQRDTYLQFARETPNAMILNTNQSLETTVSEGVFSILRYWQKM